jgi:hypothetical protein
MRRYLPLTKANRASVIESEKNLLRTNSDEESVVASTIQTPLPPPTLKVKRVDYYYSRWSRKWKYQNSGSNVIPELRPLPSDGKEDPWQEFCFVVIRTIPKSEQNLEPTFKVVVKSQYLLKACKDVIQQVAGLSWNAISLELDPQLLLTFLPSFEIYRRDLKAKANPSTEDGYIINTVDTLIEYLRRDYQQTIASIENMTTHGEITFDLLYAILVPRSTVLTRCPVTGELQALQLISAARVPTPAGFMYNLICEGIDSDESEGTNALGFFRTQSRVMLPQFEGTVKITSLDAYPIQFHPHEAEIKRSLIARGKKWSKLTGIHHMDYKGTAGFKCQGKVIKYNLNSRIMIDRSNFKRINPNYSFSMPKQDAINFPNPDVGWGDAPIADPNMYSHIPLQVESNTQREKPELTDEELLITSPVLMGFSLADKLWLEFNVEKVQPIQWNEEAFANLVLPSDRKMLLQSLVEAHSAELSGFDDFIKGKGRGLVVNLFGPPGVGKTLSAEATSEHVKRPLYVVGAGDLGTKAAELDHELQRVFELATAWKAIILIDEADVFLEQRSLHDLERNAMVAVFLRHLEYYPAILFMTTNRVKTFDEAFLSRIHIALHFHSLSSAARAQVWTAFLTKAGIKIGDEGAISAEELQKLTERDINGRQVKNATRTANSLALSRGETLRYQHIVEVLDVMDQFTNEFKRMNS